MSAKVIKFPKQQKKHSVPYWAAEAFRMLYHEIIGRQCRPERVFVCIEEKGDGQLHFLNLGYEHEVLRAAVDRVIAYESDMGPPSIDPTSPAA